METCTTSRCAAQIRQRAEVTAIIKIYKYLSNQVAAISDYLRLERGSAITVCIIFHEKVCIFSDVLKLLKCSLYSTERTTLPLVSDEYISCN